MNQPVFADAEFRRIKALPTRQPEWSAQLTQQAIALISQAFGKGTQRRVRAIQARAVTEYADFGKLVGEVGAGFGKTLTSFLLAQVAAERFAKKRILFLVPAKLREQTLDAHTEWGEHFRIPPLAGAGCMSDAHIRVLSYEALSMVSKAAFLEEWRPDIIIADEAHFLARTKSARSKRVFRYIRAARKAGENVHFIPLTGTMRRRSIRECAHIYAAALQETTPLPDHYPTLESWANCIDEGVAEEVRFAPGALLEFCTDTERTEGLAGWRKAIRRRLVSTPGVIATSEAAVDVPLILQVRTLPVPDSVQSALQTLRETGELPNGDVAEDAITVWQTARQLATGFSYRWAPAAPGEWMQARRAWNSFVRSVLEHPPKGMNLDSPLQVWQAVDAGKFGFVPEQTAWRKIRDTFKPNPVPCWISDFMIRDAEEWALRTGGIVWVGHTSALTKDGIQDDETVGKGFVNIPFFGAGDERINTYKGPCAASIRSHGTGKNLQQWAHALITLLPSSGSTLEQLLARHHRVGQTADLVHVEFYCHTPEILDAFETAQADAAYAEGLSGQPQRVLSSNILDAAGHRFNPATHRGMFGM